MLAPQADYTPARLKDRHFEKKNPKNPKKKSKIWRWSKMPISSSIMNGFSNRLVRQICEGVSFQEIQFLVKKSYIFVTPIFHWGPQEINEFIGYIKFSTLININLKYGFYINIAITLNLTYMDVQLYSKHRKTSPPYGE